MKKLTFVFKRGSLTTTVKAYNVNEAFQQATHLFTTLDSIKHTLTATAYATNLKQFNVSK